MMTGNHSHFIRQGSFTILDLIPVEKYKSTKTGIVVCLARVEGPLVNGYFCVATEAFDDDGLPHTLEHLVFMGSEIYPYKGMLDLFANRCLAQGTNAWTDTDHTCYTMTTAGSEGFLNLLPIFLDHVLYPTLKHSAYVTEVHHVNGDGEDAGVVYCEMQARENTGDSRTYLEFLRNMYPGSSGYKSETGGIMKNLRTTCSHEKVCNYHRDFYRPDNLCIVVTGQVKAEDVFAAIGPFETKILSKGTLPDFTRPWQTAVPPLSQPVVKSILFPTEDESSGTVMIGWRGPYVLDYYTNDAMKILLNYLTDTPVAPLQQALVELEDPFCSDVSYSMLENLETCFFLKLEGVGTEHLEAMKTCVNDVLTKIVSKTIYFDMERIATLLHRELLEGMNSLEDSPHDTMAQYFIGDFLYSDTSDRLQEYVDRFGRLKKLTAEKEEYWLGLIQKTMLDQPVVVIEGCPSEDLMKQMAEQEKERIKEQQKTLGEDGLNQKRTLLDAAKVENEIEPPPEIVNSLKVPSTASIHFHDVKTITNKAKAQSQGVEGIDFAVQDMPFSFQADHIKSLFVQLTVVLDTSLVPDRVRMYLPLYSELLFESPVLRDGKIVPYEDVVKQLAADTLEADAAVGFAGGRFRAGKFSKLFAISLKVETDKYQEGVQWLSDVLYKVQFTADRIRSVANKIINDVPSAKRSGRKVAGSLMRDINFTRECNSYVVNMIRQQEFLTKLLTRLQNELPQVIQDLEELRGSLTKPETLRLYLAADVNRLPKNALQIIKDKFEEAVQKLTSPVRELPGIKPDSCFLRHDGKSKVVGVGSVESSFLYQSCPSVASYNDPDYPALLVFIEYLTALEGPLWRQIRGLGLSYHYSIILDPSQGLLIFVLFKSTHVAEAYKKAKEIVEGYLSGATALETSQIEAAISGTIFEVISKEQSVGDAANQRILAEFKGVESTFSKDLLVKLSNVTADDLIRVGNKYFTNLFDPTVSRCALCCHPSKVDEVVKDFKSLSIDFEVVQSLDKEFSC